MSERFLVPLYQNESFLPENKQNFVMFFFRKNKQMSFVDAAESVANTLKLVVFFFAEPGGLLGRMTPHTASISII